MSANPLVSVLIPCFNAERWIGETLESVLSQTYANLDVVVCDDGSTDGSCDLLAGIGDPRVTVLRQDNRGQSSVLNRCLQHARGELIQFLDADDVLSREKIGAQCAVLAGVPRAISASAWARFRTDVSLASAVPDETDNLEDPVDWLVSAWRRGGGMLFPGRWLIPRHVVDKAGPWNEALTLNVDGEYFTRVLLAAGKVLFCREATCYYRSGVAGSVSGRKSREAWESGYLAFALCESYLRRREDSQRVRDACAVVWQVIAHGCYPHAPDIGKHALSRAKCLSSVRVQPEGGRAFRAVAAVAGWKFARRLQKLSGRA